MTENKNHNHTFSSDVNMPLYSLRFGSLYPLNNRVTYRSLFFFVVCVGGGGGGGEVLWSYVHHIVDVKVLCSDVVRPSGCPFIFSVHTIFDDPVKIIW